MKHFGFRRIRPDDSRDAPQVAAFVKSPAIPRDELKLTEATHSHPISRIYGNKLHEVKVAWLTTGNSVGFELFEFIDPPVRKPDLDTWTLEEQYQRGGFFHIALTVPDPDAKCEEVCEDGAARVGETIQAYDGNCSLYFRDPFGNVIELLSANYEELLANR